MASRFVTPDRDQVFMEMVSYREVLGEDHAVWTVLEVTESLDTAELYRRYRPDSGQGGRPALDPVMLLALLIWGYCEGKLSSRQLEQAARRDWAYRAICGGLVPDHATIARFRQSLDDVIADLSTQVLTVLVIAGLVDVEMVALDGTKIEAAASKEANRTEATLAAMRVEVERILAGAAAADRADDTAEDGGGGGWSGQRRQADNERRHQRIAEAQQAVVEAKERKAVEQKRNRDRDRDPVANVTDPDSRLQKTRNGFIQGYNAQGVVTADQVFVAAEVISDSTDVAMLAPMLDAVASNLEAAGVSEPVAVALADAGYWSEDNAASQPDGGVDLLIATTKTHKVGAVHPEPDPERVERDRARIEVIERLEAGKLTLTQAATELGLSTSYLARLRDRYRDHGTLESTATIARVAMEAKLAHPDNRDRYRQRGWLIEGPFAHIKWHRATRRFSRRGLAACNAEWKLITLASNILKLHRHRTGGHPTTGPPGADWPHRRRSRLHNRHRQPPRPPHPHQRPAPHQPRHPRPAR
jgi:transposase